MILVLQIAAGVLLGNAVFATIVKLLKATKEWIKMLAVIDRFPVTPKSRR